jgi:hypothetical protein
VSVEVLRKAAALAEHYGWGGGLDRSLGGPLADWLELLADQIEHGIALGRHHPGLAVARELLGLGIYRPEPDTRRGPHYADAGSTGGLSFALPYPAFDAPGAARIEKEVSR